MRFDKAINSSLGMLIARVDGSNRRVVLLE